MSFSRFRDLRRRERLSLAGATIFFAMTSIGCPGDSDPPPDAGPADSGVHPDANTGTPDTGIHPDAGPINPDVVEMPDTGPGPVDIDRLEAAGTSGFTLPFDAAPDRTAQFLYFSALGPNGPSIFKVASTGGAAIALHEGEPLEGPLGVLLSSDDSSVFVADVAAQVDTDVGVIFSVPSTGGAPVRIAGTENTRPVALDVVNENGADQIYFLGTDPASGNKAVMKVSASGGQVQVVRSGAPLIEPSGIAVSRTGTIYVLDASGFVYRFEGTDPPDILLEDIKTGFPAGIALTLDESRLVVSALDSFTGKDLLYAIILATGDVATFNQGIESFVEAGGVHRARDTDAFAWSDLIGGPNGTGVVFLVRTKPAN